GQVRAEAEYAVRNALPILVERTGRRLECCISRENVAICITRQIAQVERLLFLALFHFDPPVAERNRSALTTIGQAQNGAAQFRSRHVSRFAGDKRLSRS